MTTYTFTPPLSADGCSRTDIDPVLLKKNPLGNKLMAHFASIPIGVNVWVKQDGTITQDQPDPDEIGLIRAIYWGGHTATISLAEKTALEAAGYTVVTIP